MNYRGQGENGTGNVIANLDRNESLVEKQFRREFSAEVALADETLAVIVDGLGTLDGYRLSDDLSKVRVWLAVSFFNALRASFGSLSVGYVKEALALERVAFESWGIQAHLKDHQEFAPILAQVDQNDPFMSDPKSRKQLPSFADIWKDLEGEGPTQASLIYDWLCLHAHPRPAGLMSTYERNASGYTVRLGPAWNPIGCTEALMYWFQIAHLEYKALQVTQELVLGAMDQPWSDRARAQQASMIEMIDDLTSRIQAHNADLDALLASAPHESGEQGQ